MTSGPVRGERQAEKSRDPVLKVWAGVQLYASGWGGSASEAQLGREAQSLTLLDSHIAPASYLCLDKAVWSKCMSCSGGPKLLLLS